MFAPNFVHLVDLVLNRVFDVRFGYWSLQHIVFALVVGTTPFIALISWLIRGDNQLRSFILLNMVAGGLIAFMVAIIATLIINFAPRGIFHNVKQPSEHFWNYALIACSLCTALILFLFSSFAAKRIKRRDKMRSSEEQIDQ